MEHLTLQPELKGFPDLVKEMQRRRPDLWEDIKIGIFKIPSILIGVIFSLGLFFCLIGSILIKASLLLTILLVSMGIVFCLLPFFVITQLAFSQNRIVLRYLGRTKSLDAQDIQTVDLVQSVSLHSITHYVRIVTKSGKKINLSQFTQSPFILITN